MSQNKMIEITKEELNILKTALAESDSVIREFAGGNTLVSVVDAIHILKKMNKKSSKTKRGKNK
jgi:hypothetical protein